MGGSGDDTLIGGDGSDVLVGGPDDGLPGSDADVAVFEGSKGSYEFGVDALSGFNGLLFITQQNRGELSLQLEIYYRFFWHGPVVQIIFLLALLKVIFFLF